MARQKSVVNPEIPMKKILFAALALAGSGICALAAPANPNADPRAYQMLKAAYEARQVLPANFAGFDADVIYSEGDKSAKGTLHFRSDGKSTLEIAGLSDDEATWLQHNALSFANHRREGNFDETEGKWPLSFGKSAGSAFGQLIERNDAEHLSSRVRDGKILELTRTAGAKRFVISVLETMPCDAGKYIPTRYLVSYVDAKTGALQNVEMFENSYARIEGLWLPVGRRVVSVGQNAGAGLRERSFRFENIRIVR